MIMPLLAGCMHYMVSIELNSDSSGKITYWEASNKDMLGPYEDDVESSADKLGNADPTGVQITTEPLKYTEDGSNYEGKKTIISFDDADKFFNSYFSDENSEIEGKLADLPDGKKRLEIYADMPEDGENKEGNGPQ